MIVFVAFCIFVYLMIEDSEKPARKRTRITPRPSPHLKTSGGNHDHTHSSIVHRSHC